MRNQVIQLPTAETIEAIEAEIMDIPPRYQKKFNSTHEGFAVLKEEVDELWDAIKSNERKARLKEEAIQVAAMAIRFIQELTEEE